MAVVRNLIDEPIPVGFDWEEGCTALMLYSVDSDTEYTVIMRPTRHTLVWAGSSAGGSRQYAYVHTDASSMPLGVAAIECVCGAIHAHYNTEERKEDQDG